MWSDLRTYTCVPNQMNIHLCIASFLAVVGVFFVILGFRIAVKGWRNRTWPKVDATITESRVEEDGLDPVSYKLCVEYRYTVNGQSFRGHQIYDGWVASYSWKWVAEMAQEKYTKGLSVDVYYSPSNPATAVLKPGLNRGPFIVWAITSVLLLIAWNQFVLGTVGAA